MKKGIILFIRQSPYNTSNRHNPQKIKLLSRLRLGLSFLRNHKLKHRFQDSLNPFCGSGKGEVETSSHDIFQFFTYFEEQVALLKTLKMMTCLI